MKWFIIFAAGTFLGIAGVLMAQGVEQPSPSKAIKYFCVIFDHTNNEVVFQGAMNEKRFQLFFKKRYPTAGTRFETPADAMAFGALVLTDGEEILVMPLYTWTSGHDTHFACQSYQFGEPPMFSVQTETRRELIERMKIELAVKYKPPMAISSISVSNLLPNLEGQEFTIYMTDRRGNYIGVTQKDIHHICLGDLMDQAYSSITGVLDVKLDWLVFLFKGDEEGYCFHCTSAGNQVLDFAKAERCVWPPRGEGTNSPKATQTDD